MLFRRAAKAQDRRLLLRLPPAEITLERASALEIDDVLEACATLEAPSSGEAAAPPAAHGLPASTEEGKMQARRHR